MHAYQTKIVKFFPFYFTITNPPPPPPPPQNQKKKEQKKKKKNQIESLQTSN
jgi:hypothetical protein